MHGAHIQASHLLKLAIIQSREGGSVGESGCSNDEVVRADDFPSLRQIRPDLSLFARNRKVNVKECELFEHVCDKAVSRLSLLVRSSPMQSLQQLRDGDDGHRELRVRVWLCNLIDAQSVTLCCDKNARIKEQKSCHDGLPIPS